MVPFNVRYSHQMLKVCAVLTGILVPPPTWAEEPTVHRILIEKFAFVPKRVEIRTGDKVEWVNRDIAPHTATAIDRAWDTGILKKGASVTIEFSSLGTVGYVCSYHPHMRGEIVVVEDQTNDS